MNANSETLFEAFLNQHDQDAWAGVVKTLLPSVHEVDKAAARIWFHFYPLALARALQQAEDAEKLARKLLMQGKYYLKDQIDTSHQFLYGHRYWPEVKSAICELATSTKPPASLELATQIQKLASEVAGRVKVSESLVIGIAAVGFMTLQQVGIAAFKMSPGKVNIDAKYARRSPQEVLDTRAKDNSQGLFSFLRTIDKRWNVTFNENDEQSKFTLIDTQELATAAFYDKRDFRARDPRCIEGPIPVECRSAACGTCWVGILGGAEKLAPVGAREARKIKEFGYIDTDEPKPLIRLACMAQCYGAISIVIPPWNGVFGRHLEKLKNADEDGQKDAANSSSMK
jgi:ferredoxin